MNIPKFVVVGAHKAGTSSFHTYLNQHPEIYLPAKKGLDLLSRRKFKELHEAGEYLAQFDGAKPDQVLGEVSSVYLHQGQGFIQRLNSLFPDIKIVMILRNPIERAYSHALWDSRHHAYTQAEIQEFDRYFERLIMTSQKFLLPGLYYTHLQNYLSHFNRDQIKLFLYDDLTQNSEAVFTELFNFVGVNPEFRPDLSSRLHVGAVQVSNPYSILLKKAESMRSSIRLLIPQAIRHSIRDILYAKSYIPKPAMSDHLRGELIDYFHDEVINLEQLTGLEVSHWLKIPDRNSVIRD